MLTFSPFDTKTIDEEMSVNNTHPRSKVGLEYLGLAENENVLWNLDPDELYEEILANDEGVLSADEAIVIRTGKYTGRSPKDKYTVDQPSIHDEIDWGGFNQPIEQEVFDGLFAKMQDYLAEKKLYVKDVYCGAHPDSRLSVRLVSEAAYHALFTDNMFIDVPDEEMEDFIPGFTVLAAPSFKADPEVDGTKTDTFVIADLEKKIIIIGATMYSGEVKKGIFGIMNYLLPKQGVMPMHCSANVDDNGKSAIYFGLSGTGKTTLSADPDLTLIGDDEHGWNDEGIFNFEGGCYAKVINLSEENEPLIYATTKKRGTILENVILDENGNPDFDDVSITQNTRCSYPLEFIPNASETGLADHPANIIFLTADAFGVLPPISKLTPEQAMYHFISGYTAKVAGTERGVTEPQATFSACFGAPFMPLHPTVYAELLAERIRKHGSDVWLVNTGWTGGPYGVGSRMKLPYTRKMLSEAIAGNLNDVEFVKDPIFGLMIPTKVDGVPSELLIPRNTWKDPEAYDAKAKELAAMFVKNFQKFEDQASEAILKAAPNV
jgi:phosphoenolpyruvate carboxykinase (ATP)